MGRVRDNELFRKLVKINPKYEIRYSYLNTGAIKYAPSRGEAKPGPLGLDSLRGFEVQDWLSMWISSPHRILPSSRTRAKTPSRGMMQSPAL